MPLHLKQVTIRILCEIEKSECVLYIPVGNYFAKM